MSLEVMLVFFQVIVLIFAFSVHESAHAYAAFRLGDPTAYMLGRVTLNPLKHIDPFGSLLMPALALYYGFPLMGWAKPCPVTLRNFRKVRRDDIITTFAGPASNLALALIALVLLIVLKHAAGLDMNALHVAMAIGAGYGNQVDTTNLPQMFPIALLLYYGILINVLLFVFNLIPIPPLDGSRILRYFLPYKVEQIYNQVGGYAMILVFIFAGKFIFPIFYWPLLDVFDSILNHV
jgi:Zn-dependent protease